MIITSIVIRNNRRYFVNLLLLGSVVIYQLENSVMDHVINRVIGINVNDKVSMLMEILMFSVGVMINGVSDSVSSLLFDSWLIGIRLIRNNNMRFFLALCGFKMDMVRDRKMVMMIVGVIELISTTWICTKDFGA